MASATGAGSPAAHAQQEFVDDDASAPSLEEGLNDFAEEQEGADDAGTASERTPKPRRVGARADAEEAESEESDETDDEDEEEGEEEEEEESDDDEGEESDDEDEDEGEEEGEEESDEEEDEDESIDDEFRAAADRHQLPTAFDDIVRKLPKDVRATARQAFGQRLHAMESGFHAAMQDARGYRREQAKTQLEAKWVADHPIDHIIELLDANPKLLEQLNAELTDRQTPAYDKAKKLDLKRERKELADQADAAAAAYDQRVARAQTVETSARDLCRKLGVPYEDYVDQALYIAIVNDPKRDITDAAVRELVTQKAKAWQKQTGTRRREAKAEYVRTKHAERREGQRRVTARDRGQAPAAGRQREPKSLEEALTRAAKRIGVPEHG